MILLCVVTWPQTLGLQLYKATEKCVFVFFVFFFFFIFDNIYMVYNVTASCFMCSSQFVRWLYRLNDGSKVVFCVTLLI